MSVSWPIHMNDIPEIFKEAREYRDLPHALEDAQSTFNESAIYAGIATLARQWHTQYRRPARILDLCAATGWTAKAVAQAIPVEYAALVDTDARALEIARANLVPSCAVECWVQDAVDITPPSRFDLICMNSAYHHIEPSRKVDFLRNAHGLLDLDGEILMGEHFLPSYPASEYRRSVIDFYSLLLTELRKRREPVNAVGVIRRSALYSWEGLYEYKVAYKIFLTHLARARLQCAATQKVWPQQEGLLPPDCGSFVLRLLRC